MSMAPVAWSQMDFLDSASYCARSIVRYELVSLETDSRPLLRAVEENRPQHRSGAAEVM